MDASSLRSRPLDDRVAILCKQLDGQISLFEAELAKCKLDLGVDRKTDSSSQAGLPHCHIESSCSAPSMNLSYQGPVISHRRRVDINEWRNECFQKFEEVYEISPSSVFFLRCVLKYLSKGSVSEKDLRNAVVTECRLAGVRVNSRGGLTGSNIDVSIICGVLQTLGVLDEEKRTSIWALRRERMAAAQALAGKVPSHVPASGYTTSSSTLQVNSAGLGHSGGHVAPSSSLSAAAMSSAGSHDGAVAFGADVSAADALYGGVEAGDSKQLSDGAKPDPFEYATRNLSEISCDLDRAILSRFNDMLAAFLDNLARKKRDTPASVTPRGSSDKNAMDFDSVMLDGPDFVSVDVKLEDALDGDISSAMDLCGTDEKDEVTGETVADTSAVLPVRNESFSREATNEGGGENSFSNTAVSTYLCISSDSYSNAELDADVRDAKRIKLEPVTAVPAASVATANTTAAASDTSSLAPSIATAVPPSLSAPSVVVSQTTLTPLPPAAATIAAGSSIDPPLNGVITNGPPTVINSGAPLVSPPATTAMASAPLATSSSSIPKSTDAAALREALALLDSCKGGLRKPAPIASTSALYDSYKTKYGVDKDLVSEALRAITGSASASNVAASGLSAGSSAGGVPNSLAPAPAVSFPSNRTPGIPSPQRMAVMQAGGITGLGALPPGIVSLGSQLLLHGGSSYGLATAIGSNMPAGMVNPAGHGALAHAVHKGGRKARKFGDTDSNEGVGSNASGGHEGAKDAKKASSAASGGAGVGNGSRVWRMREDMQKMFSNPFDFIKMYADVCYTEQLALEYEELLLRQLAGECMVELPHSFVRTGTTYLKPTFAYGETDEPVEEDETAEAAIEEETAVPKAVEKKVEMHGANIIFGSNEASASDMIADVLIDRHRYLHSHPKEFTAMLQKLSTRKWELPEVFESVPLSQKSRTKSVGYSTPLVDLQFSGGASNISSLIQQSRARSVPPPPTSVDMLTLKRNPNPLCLLHNRHIPPTPFESATWRSVQRKSLESAGFASYISEGKSSSRAKKSVSKKSKEGGKGSGSGSDASGVKCNSGQDDVDVCTSMYIPDAQSKHPRFMCIPDLVIRTQPLRWLDLAAEFAPLEHGTTPGGGIVGLGLAGGSSTPVASQTSASHVSTPIGIAATSSGVGGDEAMEESDVDGETHSEHTMDAENVLVNQNGMGPSDADADDEGVDGLGELPVSGSTGLRRVISSNSIASSLSSGSNQPSAQGIVENAASEVVRASSASIPADLTGSKRRQRRTRLTIQLPDNNNGSMNPSHNAVGSIESSAKKYAAVQSPSFKLVQSPFAPPVSSSTTATAAAEVSSSLGCMHVEVATVSGTCDEAIVDRNEHPFMSPRAPSLSESEGEEDVSDAAYTRRHEAALSRMMAKWKEIQAKRQARREARKIERLIQSGAAVATATGIIVPVAMPKRTGGGGRPSVKTPSSIKSYSKHHAGATMSNVSTRAALEVHGAPASPITSTALTTPTALGEGMSTRRKAVQSFSASLGTSNSKNNHSAAHAPFSPTATAAANAFEGGAPASGSAVSTPNSVSSKSSAYSAVASISASLALTRERRSTKR